MRQARLQHACTPVNLNGRPGVVVSGGAGGANSSVEFWDLKTNKALSVSPLHSLMPVFQWLDLPPLSRGRRSHSMTTIQGRLAVAGGVAMDSNRKVSKHSLIWDGTGLRFTVIIFCENY